MGFFVDYPGHGVIAAIADGPVVGQEVIGNGGQFGKGLLVVGDNGLLGDVAAGHYQGRRIEQEQMVDAGVGQHQAEVIIVGGNLVANSAVVQAGDQDNGAGRGLKKLGLTIINLTYLPGLV